MNYGPKTPGSPFIGEDVFFRALNPKFHLNDQGELQPNAFLKSSDGSGMSLDWSKLCTALESMNRWVGHWSKFGTVDRVAELTAELIWECNHEISPDPIPGNPAHCVVPPITGMTENQEDQARVKLAREAKVIFP